MSDVESFKSIAICCGSAASIRFSARAWKLLLTPPLGCEIVVHTSTGYVLLSSVCAVRLAYIVGKVPPDAFGVDIQRLRFRRLFVESYGMHELAEASVRQNKRNVRRVPSALLDKHDHEHCGECPAPRTEHEHDEVNR